MTAVDDRWAWIDASQPDAWETGEFPAQIDHYQRYRAWWGRPWPVYREDDLEPDIPRLPDIANYQDRNTT